MSILIKNCDFVATQNDSRSVLRNASVLIEDGIISEIGAKAKASADTIIDGRGKILIPGLINLHAHLSPTILRGSATFLSYEWSEENLKAIEDKLPKEACYYGALLACLEMIKTGTTTFVDVGLHVEEAAKAARDSGLRAFLCYSAFDPLDPGAREREKERMTSAIRSVKSLGDPKIKPMVGIQAPHACDDEALLWAKDMALKGGMLLHVMVAEKRKEQAEFYDARGMRIVEYLDKIGFLGHNVLASHCVWLTKGEVKILGRSNVKVAHCPVANMRLPAGSLAPVPEMLELKVTVGLGTDWPIDGFDMFEAMKFCALAHKAYRWDPTALPARRAFDMATIEGARALNMDEEIGSIEVGKAADLALIDMRSPNIAPIFGADTVISDMVYSVRGFNVDTTIAGGRVLMEDKKIKSLDEGEVFDKALSWALTLSSELKGEGL